MNEIEKLECELKYFRARIDDVDTRSRSCPNPSARIAYADLARLYRERAAELVAKLATEPGDLHFDA